MADVNLKQVAASGMMWNAIQKYSVLAVTFVSSIVLARLLTPYEYGCVGMLEIFLAIATILIDGGFGSALIQKKRPSQEDYSTIFWWNLAMSVILYVVLFFAAPYIAKFYRIPLLSTVLRVQGIVLFINAFKMIQSNQLRKNFRFKPMSITVISSSVISVLVTIVMAYMGYGVWSLVAQNLLIALIPMVAFWFITKWKPLLLFSRKSFKELFSFGGFMFLTGIVDTISDNLQGLLIGRVYSAATMGYYSKAKTTESLASGGFAQVVSSVTYQLYAEVQDDLAMLVNIMKRLTTTLAYLTFPIIISLMMIAKPLFIILYSDRWLPSVPYFLILAFAGFAVCLQSINLQAIAAIGKSKTMFTWTIFKRVLGIVLIVIGLTAFGINGLLGAMVVSAWINYFINAWIADKHIGYKMRSQLNDLLPIVLLSVASVTPMLLIDHFINIDMYANALFMLVGFNSLYIGLSIVFKLNAYDYSKSLIPMFFNKFKRK